MPVPHQPNLMVRACQPAASIPALTISCMLVVEMCGSTPSTTAAAKLASDRRRNEVRAITPISRCPESNCALIAGRIVHRRFGDAS
jgi:hypothetical protein